MKQIVVVSDSHGNNIALEEIANKHKDAVCYLHAGDSEDYEANIYPFITIRGNNDYYVENEYRILKIDNFSIYLTHGHKMYLSKENLARKAKENKCDIIIYGHTHRPFYEFYDGIYIVNPGALSYPRSTMGETYAIITIDDNHKISVDFNCF